MAGWKQLIEDCLGCGVLRAPVREEGAGAIRNPVQLHSVPQFPGWECVSGIWVDGVHLMPPGGETFGYFGRIAVSTAIEIWMVTQR